MRNALPIFLLIGCAEPVGARWEQPVVTVCADPGLQPELGAAAASWSRCLHVPELLVEDSAGLCDIEVWVTRVDHLSTTRRAMARGEIRLATVRLSETADFSSAGYDLQSVLLHEFGHALGLPDIDAPGAVMHHEIAPGEVRQILAPADVYAVMDLYR